MRWLLEEFTEPDQLVVDPYMGSGPLLEACRDTGRRYIGIEIEPKFFASAVGRMSQAVLFR